MSELHSKISDMIIQDGPIPLELYMMLALSHPTLGYYASRDPFGAKGDFITAPEISQMFGELLGLWALEVWTNMGAPSAFHLIELGPGRGTLMADALRAAKLAPEFGAALQLHLVEASPVLIEQQRQRLAQSALVPEGAIHWHASLETIPLGPSILLANEFFDALPVRQYVKTASGWHERVIGLDNTQALSFGLAPEAETNINAQAPIGSVLEINTLAYRLIMQIAHRLQQAGGAALIIDYGHVETSFGETLQAISAHHPIDPLTCPGQADLSTHVDFGSLKRAALACGARLYGPVQQADFLTRLGIHHRAASLMRQADTTQGAESAADIAAALTRLTQSEQSTDMGALFKVMAITHPDLAPPAGFDSTDVS